MEADNPKNTNRSERPSRKYRVIGCGAVVSMMLISLLLIFSRLLDHEWFKYIPKEIEVNSAIPEATNVVGWGSNVSRDATMYIDPINDTTTIPGKDICGNQTWTLVIIVISAPSEFSRRALIRETWGSHTVIHVKTGFLVGLTKNRTIQILLEQESEQFHDIIQENIIDTYNNLTLKSIALLKWYSQNCRNSSFLMKTDSDTFVNVELLVSNLTSYPQNGVLMGHIWPVTLVPRAANDKYAVPRFMYKYKIYPNFLSGSAYIMSSDVVRMLFAAALKTPIFYLEDVFITGFCAQEAGVTPQHFPGSSFLAHEGMTIDTLICWPNHIVCHPVDPEDLQSLWEKRRDPTFQQLQFPDLKSVP